MPSFIADFSIIIVVAGSLIWCYLIYVDIQKRDSIDFDELSSDSALVNTANIDKSNIDAGNIGDISALQNNLISQAGCIGRQCCPTDWTTTNMPVGTYYNTNTRTCCYNNAVVSSEQPSACCNYSNFTTAKTAGAVGKSYYNSITKTCCELKSSDLAATTEPAACTN